MKNKIIMIAIVISGMTSCSSHKGVVNGHEYVDLGLPSGTLWATCNVGANNPQEIGALFAWGETTPLDSTYKWMSNGKYTKYCLLEELGLVDKKTELDAEDDAATVEWGNPWRMPSEKEFEELNQYCYKRIMRNYKHSGVGGQLFISKKNKARLFFPSNNILTYYWTATLDSSCIVAATHSFYSKIKVGFSPRSIHLPIRFPATYREKGLQVRAVMGGKR